MITLFSLKTTLTLDVKLKYIYLINYYNNACLIYLFLKINLRRETKPQTKLESLIFLI